MCTAITVTNQDHYFGRNLDFQHGFGENLVITPRKYEFVFRNGERMAEHYALIGVGIVSNNYPLYFDAVNETGLGMAGLYFPENAAYAPEVSGKTNVASFELIPWILSQCKTVAEAKLQLQSCHITDEAFSSDMPPSPLHWLIADKSGSITVEQTASGMHIYDNPVGVLTNNPPFETQMLWLSHYMALTRGEPTNRFSDRVEFAPYSRGMGAMGLPGDLSSASRFVRACFTKLNSVYGESEAETVQQFFHVLHSVYQQKGCVKVGEDFEMTHYTSCCNTNKGIYYYTTYYNSTIHAIDMHQTDLNSKKLVVYEMQRKGNIVF